MNSGMSSKIALTSLSLLVVVGVLLAACSDDPTPTPVASQGVIEAVGLGSTLTVSESATGLDSDGNVLSGVSGELRIENTEGSNTVIIPISLSEGSTLSSFSDSESGIRVDRTSEGYVVEIPVNDEFGRRQITIRLFTGELNGTGTSAEGEVRKIELETVEKQVDFSRADVDVGLTSVSILSELNSLPPGSWGSW